MARQFMIQSFVDEKKKKVFYSEVNSRHSNPCIIRTEILKRFIKEGYGKYFVKKSNEVILITPDTCDNVLFGLREY